MQKIKKNGFAISGIVYPILIITIFLVVQILFMLQTRKSVLDKSRTELADSVNNANQVYNNEELSTLISEQQKKIEELEKKMKDSGKNMYPVGSIYTSVKNTNPSSLFGGTWVSYGSGRTLVGVDAAQSEFSTVEKTGGEKSHVLTINEMPSHSHPLNKNVPYGMPYNNLTGTATGTGGSVFYKESYAPFTIGNAGGNQAHNNLQPYITVYMWKRTA